MTTIWVALVYWLFLFVCILLNIDVHILMGTFVLLGAKSDYNTMIDFDFLKDDNGEHVSDNNCFKNYNSW